MAATVIARTGCILSVVTNKSSQSLSPITDLKLVCFSFSLDPRSQWSVGPATQIGDAGRGGMIGAEDHHDGQQHITFRANTSYFYVELSTGT